MNAIQGTLHSFVDTPERDSVADCLVHAVVPYYLVLCVSESKNTNIFPNGQIIYAINVPRSVNGGPSPVHPIKTSSGDSSRSPVHPP